jgi:hypothetical protein
MNWKNWCFVFCAGLLAMVADGCSKHRSEPEVLVAIPTGFNGSFLLEMGVKDAPALAKRGDTYLVTVPGSGKLSTSTLLVNPHTVFQNASEGGVWGYSHSVFSTGDGIPVSGKIEFFVGTKKDYEAQENKKNHSRGFELPGEAPMGGLSSNRRG